MRFELFLLCAGTFTTGVFVFAAFIHMRSQKRALIDLEKEIEISNEASRVQRIEVIASAAIGGALGNVVSVA